MTLTHILVFVVAALLYMILLPQNGRKWALFVGSVIAIYWLQPAIIIRKVDFIFPTATLALVTLTWIASRAPEQKWTREDTFAAAIMALLVIVMSLNSLIQEQYRLTPSDPPAVRQRRDRRGRRGGHPGRAVLAGTQTPPDRDRHAADPGHFRDPENDRVWPTKPNVGCWIGRDRVRVCYPAPTWNGSVFPMSPFA